MRQADIETCNYCGLMHQGICPRVKAMEFFENGTIKRVEFHELKSGFADQMNLAATQRGQ